MKNNIMRVFLNADLRAGHDGLSKLAKDNGVRTDQLEPGNYVIFINSKRNKLKMYAANQVIAYLRLKDNRSLDLRTIKHLPRVFNGKTINYDLALSTVLEAEMAKKQKNLVFI